jgi:hypothetical protein
MRTSPSCSESWPAKEILLLLNPWRNYLTISEYSFRVDSLNYPEDFANSFKTSPYPMSKERASGLSYKCWIIRVTRKIWWNNCSIKTLPTVLLPLTLHFLIIMIPPIHDCWMSSIYNIFRCLGLITMESFSFSSQKDIY